MVRFFTFLILLAVGIASQSAAGQHTIAAIGAPDWTISDAQSAETSTFLALSVKTGKLQWHSVSQDKSILQVVALVESTKRAIGPIQFSEMTLRNQPAGGASAAREFAILAVGTWDRGCSYIDGREVPEKREVAANLASGNQFRLSNLGENKLQFAATARRMRICLAFAVPKSLPGHWVLKAGKYEIPVTYGIRAVAAPAISAKRQLENTQELAPGSGWQAIAASNRSGIAWMLAGLAAVTLPLAAFFVWRRSQTGEPVNTPLSKAGDMDIDQPIPTLSETDLPTAFANLEGQPGPGGLILSAASRAMQGEDLVSAGNYLRQAIELGLEPGHECRTRLSLGEVAINHGDLLTAIREYRNCLRSSRPIVHAVLPAATHLAVIYRKLGMRESAMLAERVVASSPVAGEALHPARVQLITRLASALKWSMRRQRLKSLFREVPGIPASPSEGGAAVK